MIEKLQWFLSKYKDLENIDKFCKWFYKKLVLNYFRKWPKYIKERQIWLCYLGKNIDGEQDWDLETFIRPVLVIKSWGTSINHITAIPLTTKEKPDKFSFKLERKKYSFLDYDSYLMLDKIKTISRKRFVAYKPIWYISEDDFNTIKEKLKNLYLDKKKSYIM